MNSSFILYSKIRMMNSKENERNEKIVFKHFNSYKRNELFSFISFVFNKTIQNNSELFKTHRNLFIFYILFLFIKLSIKLSIKS